MKTLLLSFSFVFASITAFSQYEKNPGGFYIKAGYNISTVSASEQANITEASHTGGFQLGVISDFPIGNSLLSFQSGLLLTSKGAKTTAYTIEDKSINPGAQMQVFKATVRPLYLEVPLNLVVKIPVNEYSRFYFGSGPYIAMGISGRVKGTREVNGQTISYDRKIIYKDGSPYDVRSEDNNVYKLNRFDIGLNAMAGFETGRLMIGANYGYGFSNVNAYHESEFDSNKNRVITISVGYNLVNNW